MCIPRITHNGLVRISGFAANIRIIFLNGVKKLEFNI